MRALLARTSTALVREEPPFKSSVLRITQVRPYNPPVKFLGLLAIAISTPLLLFGCGGSRAFLADEIQTIKRVAIIGFRESPENNLKGGGEAVSEAMISSLARLRSFEVIERSQVDMVLKEQGFEASGLVDARSMQQLGQLLGVDSLLLGHVSEYGKVEVSWGSKNVNWAIFLGLVTGGLGFLTFFRPLFPEEEFVVAMNVRLVSTASAKVLFTNDLRVQRSTLAEATRQACQEILKVLKTK